MATLVGPNGAALFNFHGQYRLAVAADADVKLHITDPLGADIDLTVYTGGFIGAGRRTRSEALTTAPLFVLTAVSTGPGLLTLTVLGSEIGQDTPTRGHYDLYGITVGTPNTYTLLVTGRWEAVGSSLDPAAPVPA